MGRGQGCCSISYDAQHSLLPRRVFWPKGHSAEVEEPWSGAKWTRSHDMGAGPELFLSGLSTPPAALLRPPPWLSLAQQISLNFNFDLQSTSLVKLPHPLAPQLVGRPGRCRDTDLEHFSAWLCWAPIFIAVPGLGTPIMGVASWSSP